MSMHDPIADLLTRIRNAQCVAKKIIELPSSKVKKAIAEVLATEGYIAGYHITDAVKPMLTIELKYYEGKPVIAKIARVSRPGLRAYKNRNQLPKVLGGLGIAIISTSQGVMSDKAARALGLGGEVLCCVE